MSEIEVKQTVKNFSKSELEKFRSWFYHFDSEVWDKEIEKDILSGKLHNLANQAISEHQKDKTKKL